MDDVQMGHREGLRPAKTAPQYLQDRFRGYVVDPEKVAAALLKRLAVMAAARRR